MYRFDIHGQHFKPRAERPLWVGSGSQGTAEQTVRSTPGSSPSGGDRVLVENVQLFPVPRLLGVVRAGSVCKHRSSPLQYLLVFAGSQTIDRKSEPARNPTLPPLAKKPDQRH
jgi:hypothetical protein